MLISYFCVCMFASENKNRDVEEGEESGECRDERVKGFLSASP